MSFLIFLVFLIFGPGLVLDFLDFLVCGSASYVVSTMNADFFISLIGDSEVASRGGGGPYMYIYVYIYIYINIEPK